MINSGFKIWTVVFLLLAIATPALANHNNCHSNPSLCNQAHFHCQGTAAYEDLPGYCGAPAQPLQDADGCIRSQNIITKIPNCQQTCINPANQGLNDICNKDADDHCIGNQQYKCFAPGFCQPSHADASWKDGCVRSSCQPVPNTQVCYQGQSVAARPGSFQAIFGQINVPLELLPFVKKGGDTGIGSISNFLSNGLELIFVFGQVIFVFMIVWSGFEWITSGGDKDKVTAARKRITYAILGIALMALSFFFITVIGKIIGFNLLNIDLPHP